MYLCAYIYVSVYLCAYIYVTMYLCVSGSGPTFRSLLETPPQVAGLAADAGGSAGAGVERDRPKHQRQRQVQVQPPRDIHIDLQAAGNKENMLIKPGGDIWLVI